ncbi:MAG TPA: YihY/virulence factor BrkB family protein [Candidatus Dormibacteraeota bacterium]
MKRRLLNSFPVRVIKRYLDAQGTNWGTLIAWNALFAFFPIVLVTITVLGLLLQDQGLKDSIERQIAAGFPNCRNSSNCEIIVALNSFKEKTGVFAILGLAGLFWSGSALFGAMDQALSSLSGCKARDFIPQKLMSFGMILLFTVLTVPLILSGSLLGLLEKLPLVPTVFRIGPVSLLLQLGLGILDATLLFTAIYYVVPNRRQRLRQVLPGALVAAALFEGFTLVFPLYFRLSGGFAAYGQTFALFFLLLFYFFVLGQIVMIGGAVNAERDPDLRSCDNGAGEPAGGLTPATMAGRDRVEESNGSPPVPVGSGIAERRA